MNNTKNMYRQGDLLIVSISALPTGLKKKDNILAYGEVTGHKHQLMSETVFVNLEGKQFLDLKKQSSLVHDTHAEIKLDPGKYEVIIQREYDLLSGVRQVMD